MLPLLPLIDTHAHLDQEEFDGDRPEVIRRAAEAGVCDIIAIGTTAASSRAAVELAGRFDGVWAAVGIQPNYCAQAADDDWDRIVELAGRPRVVAIGETGLDRHWDYTPLAVQQDFFRRHIDLAAERDLPFVVHMRDCGPEMLDALEAAHRRHGRLRGVMHSFSVDAAWTAAGEDPAELARRCLALDLHISFAGMVTYKKSDDLRRVAAAVPPERILIETDSPYLAPHPLRGKRNEPAYLVHTAHCLAAARGEPPDSLAARTTANARTLFRLPERGAGGIG